MVNNYKAVVDMDSRKLFIVFKSLIVGLLSGIVVSIYRLIIMFAEKISYSMYDYIRNNMIVLPLAFALLAAAGYIVGLLVYKNRMISGSGIPQVKGILMGYFKNNWLGTLCAKFIGGALAIAGGLSLGREGPSIQLGACVAEGINTKIKSTRVEKKVLIASGASAGLAAAFNAPLAGVMFSLEEIFKYFSPVILLSTMTAAIASDFVSKQIFGMAPVLKFTLVSRIPLNSYWILVLLGVMVGLLGALYNYVLINTQNLYKSIKWLSVKTRPIVPFFLAGILGLAFPTVLCGGNNIIEELNLSKGLSFLILLFIVKFSFSMISFGSGAPGGIFFPLLVMGSVIGAVFANLAIKYMGYEGALFYNFVILAMAGYFTAIVRAPITGIVLIVEMTGSFSQLLPLTIVSMSAYIVADLVKSRPIYELLLENQLRSNKIEMLEEDASKKIVIDLIVQHGSIIANNRVKDIKWPEKCLVLAVKREGREIIPKGDTKIKEGDYLVVITDLNIECQTREELLNITINQQME